MKILNIEQGTQAWHEARRNMVTGTKLDSVMGTPLDRVNLACELIAEEGTEQSKIMKATAEMERGTSEEIFAIKAYEKKTGKKVEQIGVCISDEYDYLANSPDGLIKNEEGKYTEAVEVKSPDSKTAVFYMLANIADDLGLTKSKQPWLGIPAQYKWQCVDYFLVNTDLLKLHFLVYDERFINEEKKLTVITLERTDERVLDAIKEAKEGLESFRVQWMKWRDLVLPDNF
jgi:predicted phage-related endonuclease